MPAQVYAEEGVAGFYKGCLTNLVRTTPAAALTFTSFELIARRLKAMGQRQRDREALEVFGHAVLRPKCSCTPSADAGLLGRVPQCLVIKQLPILCAAYT